MGSTCISQFLLAIPAKSGLAFGLGCCSRFNCHPSKLHTRRLWPSKISCAQNPETQEQQQQLSLSVLRFTLGIPGLDESYLPRWIGYAFGSLILLNHFLGSDSSTILPPQLRTEVLGLILAAFSIAVPYFGKFLKGSSAIEERSIPEGAEQTFVMSEIFLDNMEEDLAWATYVLLRNTSTISVLISIEDGLCARGYWNIPKGLSKEQECEWFDEQLQQTSLFQLKDTLYFPQATGSDLWGMLPKGIGSVLVQPVPENTKQSADQTMKSVGFILLASSSNYAYNTKDKAWVRAIAKKFTGR